MNDTPSQSSGCRGCWWQEGGRCYVDDAAPREKDGRSTLLATTRCARFLGKRAVLEKVIPSDKLIIASEHKAGDQ